MMHKGKFLLWFSNLQASIGYIPALLTFAAVILSSLIVWLDRAFESQINQYIPWLFGGSADAARGLLSTIATSLITVISIAFSITIIALQQAAANYSPRVLRTFTSDKGNQIVLGMYLATFTYSLLVLSTVRSESTNGGFVPSTSIAVAIALTLICLGLLIYFINKMYNSLQAIDIIKKIHKDIQNQFDTLYPERIGESAGEELSAQQIFGKLKQSKKQCIVYADKAGFVATVNEEILAQIKTRQITWIYVPKFIGDFVNQGDILAIIDNLEYSKELENIIKQAIEINSVRSIIKDPSFGFRQLVDVALRAISPSINDPTTAEYALRYMGDNLRLLAQRKFPDNRRTFPDSSVHFILNYTKWEDYIELTFKQLRREAVAESHLLHVMIDVLASIAKMCISENRKEPIRKQLLLIEETVRASDFIKSDKSSLLKKIKKKLEEL